MEYLFNSQKKTIFDTILFSIDECVDGSCRWMDSGSPGIWVHSGSSLGSIVVGSGDSYVRVVGGHSAIRGGNQVLGLALLASDVDESGHMNSSGVDGVGVHQLASISRGIQVLGGCLGVVRVEGGHGPVGVGDESGGTLLASGVDESGHMNSSGVNVVGVHQLPSFSQGIQVLSGGLGVVRVEGGHGAVGVGDQRAATSRHTNNSQTNQSQTLHSACLTLPMY